MAIPKAPSTTALDTSLSKILGTKKKPTTGPIGYEPGSTFRPGEDIINVSGNPATGATTAEEWGHAIALENQRQQALEFQFRKEQAAEAQSLGLTQEARAAAEQEQRMSLARAAEGRAAQQMPLAMAEQAQRMEAARIASDLAAKEAYMKYPWSLGQMQDTMHLLRDQKYFQGGTPITPASSSAYEAWRSQPGYAGSGTYIPNVGTAAQPMTFKGYSSGGWTPAPRYVAPVTQQAQPVYRAPYAPWIR